MAVHSIPFNRASLEGKEHDYMAEAIALGHLAGDGTFTARCHRLLEETVGVRKAFLTTSCTHALEMSALLLEFKPGDEVIVPAFTFVSSINAFVLRGARPRFIDVRPDTLNLDETKLEQLITSRTKAIVVVHYAGVGCEMDAILDIAGRHGVAVIEDNAHGLYGTYKGKQLGSFGCFAAQSFHETKNFTCGEGGALLINDPQYVERAEIIREKGTNRSRFFRGQVDKYTWVDIGSSYLPSELLAAFLLAQLEQRESIQAKRRRVWRRYAEELGSWADTHDVRMPIIPDECQHSYHMFYMLLPSLERRQHLIDHLRSAGIAAPFHYLPLHRSDAAKHFGSDESDCPVAEDVSDRLVRLPFFNSLTEADQARVIKVVRECDLTR